MNTHPITEAAPATELRITETLFENEEFSVVIEAETDMETEPTLTAAAPALVSEPAGTEALYPTSAASAVPDLLDIPLALDTVVSNAPSFDLSAPTSRGHL
jgi:hypothetical protein